ncbi:MAG: hypothetical protein AVDCRST_MAG96-3080, partial [uncultured Segetibacter sp.]
TQVFCRGQFSFPQGSAGFGIQHMRTSKHNSRNLDSELKRKKEIRVPDG